MSRLDSFIRRMEAQRTCLNAAAAATADLPGPVLEFGLGNGRTFDHLREILPDADIHVFERDPKPHPDCWPPADRLHRGDVEATLAGPIGARLAGTVRLIHSDLGTGDATANAALHERLAPLYAPLLRPGGIAVINHEMSVTGWRTHPLPDGVRPGRYFLYRRPSD